jgi:uncharacterized membrane protein
LVNVTTGLNAAGTLVAPWLRANGQDLVATIVYGYYRFQCPQRPSHSFFLFGEKMRMEQRMVAIYSAWFVAGMTFTAVRHHLRPLSNLALCAASLPIAVDLGTQMIGLRSGVWGMRVLTGGLFAVATMWWALPRAESGTSTSSVRETLHTGVIHGST